MADVVNWSNESFPIFVAESMEDRYWAQSKVFNELIVPSESLSILEIEVAFTNSLCLIVEDIYIVDNSSCVAGIVLNFIAVANEVKDV
jgi:hypothetical protein